MSDRHQAQAYPLRLPDDLKAKVAEAAKESGRSLNAEIIARLHRSFDEAESDSLNAQVGRTLLDLLKAHSHPSSELPKGLKGAVERFAPALGRTPNWEPEPADDGQRPTEAPASTAAEKP